MVRQWNGPRCIVSPPPPRLTLTSTKLIQTSKEPSLFPLNKNCWKLFSDFLEIQNISTVSLARGMLYVPPLLVTRQETLNLLRDLRILWTGPAYRCRRSWHSNENISSTRGSLWYDRASPIPEISMPPVITSRLKTRRDAVVMCLGHIDCYRATFLRSPHRPGTGLQLVDNAQKFFLDSCQTLRFRCWLLNYS